METGVFHEDLVEEILLRLPPISLLKFRCVSRSWHSLITSSRFILAHVCHNKRAKNHRVLLRTFDEAGSQVGYKLCHDNENLDEILTINCLFVSQRNKFLRMVGCVDGLACLSDDVDYVMDTVIIWNPVIRRFLSLPKLKLDVDSTNLGRSVVGFGYDSIKNDYKVIKITYRKNPCFDACQNVASIAIFRISSLSWEVTGSASVPLLGSRQTYVNGIIHWLAYNKLVVGFDMKTEAFSDMKLPETLQNANNIDLTIALWCDLLSVFHNGYWSGTLSLWVMKDYGVPSAWVKQFVIESYVMVKCLRSNGCIILENIGGKLVVFDPRINRIKQFRTQFEGTIHGFHMEKYVESLVLLDHTDAQVIP